VRWTKLPITSENAIALIPESSAQVGVIAEETVREFAVHKHGAPLITEGTTYDATVRDRFSETEPRYRLVMKSANGNAESWNESRRPVNEKQNQK